MLSVQLAIDNTVLTQTPDKRLSLFSKGDAGLDSCACTDYSKFGPNKMINMLLLFGKILRCRECSSSWGCYSKKGSNATWFSRRVWLTTASVRFAIKQRNCQNTSFGDAD